MQELLIIAHRCKGQKLQWWNTNIRCEGLKSTCTSLKKQRMDATHG